MIVQKISEQWLAGLPSAEREGFKKEVLSSKKVLDKLKEMLYNIGEGKRESVLHDYDSPSWAFKQAHINGEVAMIKAVIELISITEREDSPKI